MTAHRHHSSSDLSTALMSFSALRRIAWAVVPIVAIWLAVLWALT